MARDVPTIVGVRTVDDDRARYLWSWLLRRHGLSEGTRFRSVAEIADATLGLHAARLPSPFTTAISRSVSPAVALALFDSAEYSGLITVRCMRKTLHMLPPELASLAHSATLHFRERDAIRAITNAGVSIDCVAKIIENIVKLLDRGGPLSPRTIGDRLTTYDTSVVDIRLALKLAWERGVLAYRNDSRGWNRENRMFGLTARLHPDFDAAIDGRKASGELVRAYFDRYGPASLRDAVWWSGLSRSAVTTAMNESARSFVAISTPWCDSPLYMYQDRYEQFHDAPSHEQHHSLGFLAHEDVALKAYFESRKRYLGALPSQRVFNQIGEALPTIIHAGQVVGRWKWDADNMGVRFSLIRGYGSPHLRTDVTREARRLTEILRLRWIAD